MTAKVSISSYVYCDQYVIKTWNTPWFKFNSSCPYCRYETWKMSHCDATMKSICLILYQRGNDLKIGHCEVVHLFRSHDLLNECHNMLNFLFHILDTIEIIRLVFICNITLMSHRKTFRIWQFLQLYIITKKWETEFRSKLHLKTIFLMFKCLDFVSEILKLQFVWRSFADGFYL